jgi:hypothetical protein
MADATQAPPPRLRPAHARTAPRPGRVMSAEGFVEFAEAASPRPRRLAASPGIQAVMSRMARRSTLRPRS